jgi:hypothetical protein
VNTSFFDQVPKLMDKLADQKKLIRKDFGKAKVYLADQSQYKEVSNEEMEEMDQRNQQLKAQLAQALEEAAVEERALNLILGEPTDAEIDKELAMNEQQVGLYSCSGTVSDFGADSS